MNEVVPKTFAAWNQKLIHFNWSFGQTDWPYELFVSGVYKRLVWLMIRACHSHCVTFGGKLFVTRHFSKWYYVSNLVQNTFKSNLNSNPKLPEFRIRNKIKISYISLISVSIWPMNRKLKNTVYNLHTNAILSVETFYKKSNINEIIRFW